MDPTKEDTTHVVHRAWIGYAGKQESELGVMPRMKIEYES